MAAVSGESLYDIVCREMKKDEPYSLHPRALDCQDPQVFKDDPRITSAKNYLDLSWFTLEFAEKKAKEGSKYMLQIAKEHPTPHITYCANYIYKSANLIFTYAKYHLFDGGEMSAHNELSSLLLELKYCEGVLLEARIENPPINKMVALLNTIAYYATKHIN
ncbi:hypothetical protein Lal_00043923 [Lupinus albus]|nr:hypothetical protein Lal_00043923 [Lupinus albus]